MAAGSVLAKVASIRGGSAADGHFSVESAVGKVVLTQENALDVLPHLSGQKDKKNKLRRAIER